MADSPPTWKCERCGGEHATLHLTSIEGGVAKERHYCRKCALEAPLGFPFVEGKPGRWEPPPRDWLTDEEKARLVCRSCGHVNQENWNYCSACGTMRAP